MRLASLIRDTVAGRTVGREDMRSLPNGQRAVVPAMMAPPPRDKRALQLSVLLRGLFFCGSAKAILRKPLEWRRPIRRLSSLVLSSPQYPLRLGHNRYIAMDPD
jgi:hypothetical protein